MVLDTLVYSVSLLLIPINIAAIRANYLLMNLGIAMLVTSWATHSIWHVKDSPCTTVYCSLDYTVCKTTIIISFFHGLLYATFIQFMVAFTALLIVLYSFYKLKGNPNYHKRGLENWHHHKYHILMHISAVVSLSVISF